MAKVEQGDTVHVHYTGKLEDGTVFDTSDGRDPIEFTLGEGKVIPGFEKAVEGLTVGDTTRTTLEPEEAYGLRRDELVMTVPKDDLPDGMSPSVGDQLEMQTQDGQKLPVRVTDSNDESIQIDANHPLAGRELHFDLELVKIA